MDQQAESLNAAHKRIRRATERYVDRGACVCGLGGGQLSQQTDPKSPLSTADQGSHLMPSYECRCYIASHFVQRLLPACTSVTEA